MNTFLLNELLIATQVLDTVSLYKVSSEQINNRHLLHLFFVAEFDAKFADPELLHHKVQVNFNLFVASFSKNYQILDVNINLPNEKFLLKKSQVFKQNIDFLKTHLMNVVQNNYDYFVAAKSLFFGNDFSLIDLKNTQTQSFNNTCETFAKNGFNQPMYILLMLPNDLIVWFIGRILLVDEIKVPHELELRNYGITKKNTIAPALLDSAKDVLSSSLLFEVKKGSVQIYEAFSIFRNVQSNEVQVLTYTADKYQSALRELSENWYDRTVIFKNIVEPHIQFDFLKIDEVDRLAVQSLLSAVQSQPTGYELKGKEKIMLSWSINFEMMVYKLLVDTVMLDNKILNIHNFRIYRGTSLLKEVNECKDIFSNTKDKLRGLCGLYL